MLPPILVFHPHVESRPDVMGGSPFVSGTKIPVRRLWAWHKKGVGVETLLKRYPSVGAARVLSALAFAYDNQELMTADLAREQELLGEDAEAVPGAMKQSKLPFES